jgi:hypothetical protein
MESPIVFEQAVWAAHAQGFVDYREAILAIKKYQRDYATMPAKPCNRMTIKPFRAY